MKTLKKYMKLALVWFFIPLFLDLINIIFLGGRLPKLLLMFDFYIFAIIYSTLAWIIYTTIVMVISKRKKI